MGGQVQVLVQRCFIEAFDRGGIDTGTGRRQQEEAQCQIDLACRPFGPVMAGLLMQAHVFIHDGRTLGSRFGGCKAAGRGLVCKHIVQMGIRQVRAGAEDHHMGGGPGLVGVVGVPGLHAAGNAVTRFGTFGDEEVPWLRVDRRWRQTQHLEQVGHHLGRNLAGRIVELGGIALAGSVKDVHDGELRKRQGHGPGTAVTITVTAAGALTGVRHRRPRPGQGSAPAASTGTGHQHQPPAPATSTSTGHQHRPPAASRQPPAASRQPPATSRQPPAASRQPPAKKHTGQPRDDHQVYRSRQNPRPTRKESPTRKQPPFAHEKAGATRLNGPHVPERWPPHQPPL